MHYDGYIATLQKREAWPEGCSAKDQLLIVPRSGKLGGEERRKENEDGATHTLFSWEMRMKGLILFCRMLRKAESRL